MKLRKEIEIGLTLFTTFQIILTICINNFDLKAIPFILINLLLIAFNLHVLRTYGRGLFLEKEND